MGSGGIRPSAAREVVARWQEGLSAGLGPASTAEEGIPAGEQGSAAPHRCCAGASRPLPAAGDKNTNEHKELVLPWPAECAARQGGLVGAVLWGGMSLTEPWEPAVPGHGCGFAVSLVGHSHAVCGELLGTL